MNMQMIQKLTIPVLRKYGVTRAAVFGSAAKEEMTEKSDIDLLVELPHDVHGFDYVNLKVDLQEDLESVLKRPVDIVEFNLIKPALQPYISQSQVQIL